MCISPITIPNPTKYVSTRFRDRYLLTVPCQRCCECESTNRNQWYYRAYYEWLSCAEDNGYIMLDCLTYKPKSLPHLSDFWSMITKSDDYPCFNRHHIRLFTDLFYKRLERAGYKGCVRHFLAGEYGTDPNRTHRPHIHLLFYVHNRSIDPFWLSALIAACWPHGRTDGLPYKPKLYVSSHNYIDTTNSQSALRSCSYVTKYVQKSCEFQNVLDVRLARTMRTLADYAVSSEFNTFSSADDWLQSEYARRERNKLKRYVNQFHRQNQHFGELALRDLDLQQYMKDGVVYMPDSKALKIPVVLPTYYKRKLFYDLVEIDGARYWQLNDLGLEFREARHDKLIDLMSKRFESLNLQYHLQTNPNMLAQYVYDYRGRIKADLPESTLEVRLPDVDFYNYVTCSDKLQFGSRGLSLDDLGNSQVGYSDTRIRHPISVKSFIDRYTFSDSYYESQLQCYQDKLKLLDDGKQRAYQLKQRLSNIYQQFK